MIDFQAVLLAGLGGSLDTDADRALFETRRASSEFESSGTQEVAESLLENIKRIKAHAMLPVSIFNYGRQYQEVYNRFYSECDVAPIKGIHESDCRQMHAQMKAYEWYLGNLEFDSSIGSVTSLGDVSGFAANPNISDYNQAQRELQIKAFRSSLVIEAWGVFESISEDLWESAINFHPTILGDLNGKAKISFNDLQRYRFNLRYKMGTILKRHQAVGFRSLWSIRDSYELAFSQ